MSCVPSWVLCADGRYYKDLTYRDIDDNWFIVFNDDDPMELVIKTTSGLEAENILKDLGFNILEIKKVGKGGRVFKDAKVCSAFEYYVFTRGCFPIPREWDGHDGFSETPPKRNCVIWGTK